MGKRFMGPALTIWWQTKLRGRFVFFSVVTCPNWVPSYQADTDVGRDFWVNSYLRKLGPVGLAT